jgi:hypothetical protein
MERSLVLLETKTLQNPKELIQRSRISSPLVRLHRIDCMAREENLQIRRLRIETN